MRPFDVQDEQSALWPAAAGGLQPLIDDLAAIIRLTQTLGAIRVWSPGQQAWVLVPLAQLLYNVDLTFTLIVEVAQQPVPVWFYDKYGALASPYWRRFVNDGYDLSGLPVPSE